MSTIVVEKNAITLAKEPSLNCPTRKSPLVARWIMDKNGRLICQWIGESS